MEARLIRARYTRTVINIRVTAHVASFTRGREPSMHFLKLLATVLEILFVKRLLQLILLTD